MQKLKGRVAVVAGATHSAGTASPGGWAKPAQRSSARGGAREATPPRTAGRKPSRRRPSW